nr:MAG TPA: hypothetical protein [Caudoviricetes sp.]
MRWLSAFKANSREIAVKEEGGGTLSRRLYYCKNVTRPPLGYV